MLRQSILSWLITPRELELLRFAVNVTYVDDDCPTYDKEGGWQDVGQLSLLLGMDHPNVTKPTSFP